MLRWARTECAHAFHFPFQKWSGKSELFFLSMTKIQLKQVNLKLSQQTIDAPSTGRFGEASSGPEKSLVQHGLVEEKKANFVNRRKLLLRGCKFKKPNTTDLERDLQRPRLRRSTIDWRRQTWTPSAGRSSCLGFFFYDRLTTLDLRFLLWKYRRWRRRRKYRRWKKRERARAGIEPTAAAPSQPDCPGVSRPDHSTGSKEFESS